MKNITINFSFSEFYKKCLAFYKNEKMLNVVLSIITIIYLLNPNVPMYISVKPVGTSLSLLLVIFAVVAAFLVFHSFGFIPILIVLGTIRAIVLHQFFAMFIFFSSLISLSSIVAIFRTHQYKKWEANIKSKETLQEPVDFMEDREPSEKYRSRFK